MVATANTSNMQRSKMLFTKAHIEVELSCVDNNCNYEISSLVDNENRKELVRLGAVGRRRAIVALPANYYMQRS